MEDRIDDLQQQINKLQIDLAQSVNNATAANRATAASTVTASNEAKQALSIGQANTAGIEALNAKIDQMFKRRPVE